MIVPEGKRLILDPKDEYTHPPEPVSNYNESMYFNAFSADQPVGAWMRIGNRPNEGHAEMTVCVYLPDGSVGFMFRRPQIDNNDRMAAGGLSFEVVEPFRHHRLRYDGEVLLLRDPHQMIEPGKAFKANPTVPCRVELDIHGVSPMHGGEIVEADGAPWDLDPTTAVFRGHTEQHTRAEGTITVGDQTWPIAGPGFRDKSWGPRFWQSFYWYKWVPVTFGPDFCALLSYMGRPDGPPVVSGHIFRDGKMHPLRNARVEVEYDANFYQTAMTATLQTDTRSYVIRGEMLSLIPLRHRREMPDGSTSTARITEAMARYSCDGHTAYGMSEFLDLLVEHDRPISVALEEPA